MFQLQYNSKIHFSIEFQCKVPVDFQPQEFHKNHQTFPQISNVIYRIFNFSQLFLRNRMSSQIELKVHKG